MIYFNLNLSTCENMCKYYFHLYLIMYKQLWVHLTAAVKAACWKYKKSREDALLWRCYSSSNNCPHV